MRKFMIIVVVIVTLFLGTYYAIYHQGFYLNLEKDVPINVPFRTQVRMFQRQNKEREYEELIFRGVDVTSSLPGQYASEFAPEKTHYLRWFEAIGDMGANTIRATTVMDSDFYNALYTYNTTHEQPLYLLQGTTVSDAANYGSGDTYNDSFYACLLQDGLNLVDIIHGRKDLVLRGTGITEYYRLDISPWVVGYLLGSEWNPDTVIYTDHSAIYPMDYQGTYFSTTEDATVFEAMLAQVMDKITVYETDKYHTQRPIGFINDPSNDFLPYEENYARQLGKYSYIDAEHIQGTEALLAGQFAAYRLYDFCDNFSAYLSEKQKVSLYSILSSLDTNSGYDGYLQLLSEYHSMPVLATGYGISSSRGSIKQGQVPITEEEQGQYLMDIYFDIINARWSGAFISTWQDVWERRSWNTAFAMTSTNQYRWHDLQSDAKGYGLMAFDPGEKTRTCTINGDPSEWSEEDIVLKENDITLSARYDQEGLYLLIQGEKIHADQTALYIPIDTTQESGSLVCEDPMLLFDRAADFILYLNGPNRSRLLVHERYDATRQNFNRQILGINPFVQYPEIDTPRFVPVYMALSNDTLIDDTTICSPKDWMTLTALDTLETGKLVHGNGDPQSEDYNSLADFCYGEDCVEVRIPWLLINVGDPCNMLIHSDYYTNYGVEFQNISKIWFGIADSSNVVNMQALKLKRLGIKPKYHARLKKSYYVVQETWRGGDMGGEDS